MSFVFWCISASGESFWIKSAKESFISRYFTCQINADLHQKCILFHNVEVILFHWAAGVNWYVGGGDLLFKAKQRAPVYLNKKKKGEPAPMSTAEANRITVQVIQCGERFDIYLRN